MFNSVFKDNNMKVGGSLITVLLLFLLISLWLGCAERQVPLIQLTTEANNRFVDAGVRNIVFFDKEANPTQILDLAANQPPQVRESKKNEIFPVSPDASVGNPDPLKPLLPAEQAKNLLERNFPYIEYRNDKDQQLVVFEIEDDGTCLKCKRVEEKGYLKHSKLSIQQDKNGLLDYVIKPVGAACPKTCIDCARSPNCRMPDGACCNCRRQ